MGIGILLLAVQMGMAQESGTVKVKKPEIRKSTIDSSKFENKRDPSPPPSYGVPGSSVLVHLCGLTGGQLETSFYCPARGLQPGPALTGASVMSFRLMCRWGEVMTVSSIDLTSESQSDQNLADHWNQRDNVTIFLDEIRILTARGTIIFLDDIRIPTAEGNIRRSTTLKFNYSK